MVKEIAKIIPVTDVVLEINKFAFMALDNPGVKKLDYAHGALFGFGSLHDTVSELQKGKCLLCKNGIEHYHHIVPRSKRGSNTIANIAGLCAACHAKVHTNAAYEAKLASKKNGLTKKYGALSVLNQIIPYLFEELSAMYPEHTFATSGENTHMFRSERDIAKDHDADAYCIACSVISDPNVSNANMHCYLVKQFRRHDRAHIKSQRERTYSYEGEVIAKNRNKRFEQKDDSLAEWYASAIEKYGAAAARKMLADVSVKKSTRHYNDLKRILPGAVFKYGKKNFVLKGQQNNGTLYYAYSGEEKRTLIPASKTTTVRKGGLVFMPGVA